MFISWDDREGQRVGKESCPQLGCKCFQFDLSFQQIKHGVENEEEEILLGLFKSANTELINALEIICNSAIPINEFVADRPR